MKPVVFAFVALVAAGCGSAVPPCLVVLEEIEHCGSEYECAGGLCRDCTAPTYYCEECPAEDVRGDVCYHGWAVGICLEDCP